MNKYLPIWPFLKTGGEEMPFERRQKIRDDVMRRIWPLVLRKMVKHFGLSEAHYPIHTNPSKPVLLISDYVDLDKAALSARAVAKQLVEVNSLRRLKAAIQLQMKACGPSSKLLWTKCRSSVARRSGTTL